MHSLGMIKTVGLCGAIMAMTGCASSMLFERELTTKTNTQTVLAFEETVFNKHEVQEAFTHYVGSGFVEHDARLPGIGADADGAVQARGALVSSYRGLLTDSSPASHRSFERTVAQGDLVAAQSLWDRQPGRSRPLQVVDIYRLREGRIVEHWAVMQE